MKVGVVKEFAGEYRFLSNFFYASFIWRSVEYPTGEHAFAAAKGYAIDDSYLNDIIAHQDKVLKQKTPKEAKDVGRSLKINVAHWDEIKVPYMREIVHAKFANNTSDVDLVGKLINTGAMMLVEGNTWDDTFWGRCNGKGFNTLGALLMQERGYWLSHVGVCPNCKHVI